MLSNTDVRTTFMPSSALSFAARVITERASEAGVRVAAASAAEAVANTCQLALEGRDYSDAPANPRGRERLLREIAESPAVDELAAVLTQFILTRFGSEEPTRAQRQNTRGFAHKRLGFFLNVVDELLSGHATTGGVRGEAIDADTTAEAVLRPRARRRGLTLQQRRAVEQHAVDIVTQVLTAEGWSVSDVGATHSYDLHCSSVDEEELYVEVKGTTGPLSSILLTAKEVPLARTLHPATALFVVHDITLGGSPEEPVTDGGDVHSVRPWSPDDERLAPTAFSYRLL